MTYSIRRLRVLILLALVIGTGAFTATVLVLVDNFSARFKPEVRADLEWRALRGATEIARAADLGIAMGDAPTIQQAFEPHLKSKDVHAIVAIDTSGKVLARTGAAVPTGQLFAGVPKEIVEGPGYIASWSPVAIEGAEIGKVAIAVSTSRLTETQATLSKVAWITLLAGALTVAGGVIVILFFTRAVASRDAQLAEHAATLEKRVEDRTRELDERNRGMRLVLDNVAQGFVTIDADGVMAPERSAVVDQWFGASPDGTFAGLVRAHAPDFAGWLEANLAMMRDGVIPAEVCLGQMPPTFIADARTYAVSYSPIEGARVLVIISDVTEQLGRERAERDQRELVTVFQRIGGDRQACESFLDEGRALVESMRTTCDRGVHERALHTLKGIAGMFGFERFAELCHATEDELRESGELVASQRERVEAGWAHVGKTTKALVGDARNTVQIDRIELELVIAKARLGTASGELATRLARWADEPVSRRFERLGQQASILGRRLGKGEIEIAIDDGGVRLDAQRWAPLWAAIVHVVRNAVDHGIEAPDVRERAGKPRPRLELVATQTESEIRIAISDDGKGVDWDAIRARARRLGRTVESKRDLVDALFAGGLSTRDEVTDTSGRGVGMSALQAAVAALDGSTDVVSTPGLGTRVELRFVRHPQPQSLAS